MEPTLLKLLDHEGGVMLTVAKGILIPLTVVDEQALEAEVVSDLV